MEPAACASAVRESAGEYLRHNQLIRVATKYPAIAKDYFYNKKNQTVEIIKLNGSIELAPIVGLSEVIVDIVETGSTPSGKWPAGAGGDLPPLGPDGSESREHADGKRPDHRADPQYEADGDSRPGLRDKRRKTMRIVALTEENEKRYTGKSAEAEPQSIRKI